MDSEEFNIVNTKNEESDSFAVSYSTTVPNPTQQPHLQPVSSTTMSSSDMKIPGYNPFTDLTILKKGTSMNGKPRSSLLYLLFNLVHSTLPIRYLYPIQENAKNTPSGTSKPYPPYTHLWIQKTSSLWLTLNRHAKRAWLSWPNTMTQEEFQKPLNFLNSFRCE